MIRVCAYRDAVCPNGMGCTEWCATSRYGERPPETQPPASPPTPPENEADT